MLTIGRHVSRLTGYAPALPTPFTDTGAVDYIAFERFCEIQIEQGATAFVVCGTTGESPTLDEQEQRNLIRTASAVARRQVPVIAGAGSNSTSRAIELTRNAEAAGADAILSVVPYYNKPTQAGLLAHFGAIAAATGLPIILYDVPSRTACGLADDTVAKLAENTSFIGLKDATGDVSRISRLRPRVGAAFPMLSGDDATAAAYLSQGGDGCISVTSNVAPGLCRNLFVALRQSRIAMAQQLAAPVAQLTAVLFRETSPGPLKHALHTLGLMPACLRLPLVPPSEAVQAEIDVLLAQLCETYGGELAGEPARNGERTFASDATPLIAARR